MYTIRLHFHRVMMSAARRMLPLPHARRTLLLFVPFCAALLTSCGQPFGNEERIPIYITPYYDADGPQIAIGKYSEDLARANATNIGKTVAAMKADWDELRPEAMYVAAIRLFDLGLKDEAVYWFYSAQYRARLFIALSDPALGGAKGGEAFELSHVYNAFFQLSGEHINPYAFRNPKRLAQTVAQVRAEGKTIPDFTKLYPNVAFVDGAQWKKLNEEASLGMGELVEIIDEHAAAFPDGVPEDIPDDDDGQMHPRRVWPDPQVAALVMAAHEGDVDEIDRLVAAGVDVNAKGLMWYTPLYWTLRAESKLGFKRLLEQSANPNIETKSGDSVVHLAAHLADDSEWLELALEHGGNPNLLCSQSPYPHNRPPIFEAILRGHTAGVRLLIEAGADIHEPDEHGMTPLEQAVRGGDYDIAYLLLKAGADYRHMGRGGTEIGTMILEASFREGPQTAWHNAAIEFIKQDSSSGEDGRHRDNGRHPQMP